MADQARRLQAEAVADASPPGSGLKGEILEYASDGLEGIVKQMRLGYEQADGREG